MKFSHLVPKRSGTSVHYHFRSKIPKDLVSYFGGRKQFQISLHDVSNRDTYLVSQTLKNLVQGIYSDIRNGMKDLNLEDIKEILRIEVRKSILFSHQINEGSNKHTERGVLKGLEYVLDLEKKLQQRVDEDLGSYRKEIEEKLEGILDSLDIRVQRSSVEFKKLRNRFIDLYLMRTSWIKELINNTGKSDDDFRREVDEKLNMNLFPELSEKLTPIIENFIPEPTQPYRVQETLSPHQLTKISVGIDKFINEKTRLTKKSEWEIRTTLNMLIEDFGDIPLGKLTREMGTRFKEHLRKLPKNRTKNPKFRDKDFHQLVKMDVDSKDLISTTTVNNHLGYLSSFMEWGVIHGFLDVNIFKGMKIRSEIRPRDQRDRFTELEIKQIFHKENYIHYTKVEEGRWELYWCPLISTFSGMRLNEICSLYLDNIRQIKGNHRDKRWCIDILEEPERPDKHLKTLSSRRIVPIHDTLLDLGLIEFIDLMKKRQPTRQRLFQELKYGETSYIRNVSRFFNQRYLPKLGLKTDRKTFHSLRHTVIDHLKQKGIEVSLINDLVGHHSGNIDLDRYGKGYNPDILFNKCVKKINYQTSHNRGIDFKVLKIDWSKIIPQRDWNK